jgi:hypothetical protein
MRSTIFSRTNMDTKKLYDELEDCLWRQDEGDTSVGARIKELFETIHLFENQKVEAMVNKNIKQIVLPGRAQTPQQKREVMEKLLAAWLKAPELRLGQLVDNAMYLCAGSRTLFYVEDTFLVEIVEDFTNKI